MYTYKFTNFNDLYDNPIVPEKKTLEVLLDSEFEGRIPKEFKNITPDEWARYAFENNDSYVVMYYKNEEPYVLIMNIYSRITYSYYTLREGKLFNYMNITYTKGDFDLENDEFILYNDKKMFLSNIQLIADLGKIIAFRSDVEVDNVFSREFIEKDGEVYEKERSGTADLSKNWFDAPKDYLDYERLIDYQALFDSMPTLSTKKK